MDVPDGGRYVVHVFVGLVLCVYFMFDVSVLISVFVLVGWFVLVGVFVLVDVFVLDCVFVLAFVFVLGCVFVLVGFLAIVVEEQAGMIWLVIEEE